MIRKPTASLLCLLASTLTACPGELPVDDDDVLDDDVLDDDDSGDDVLDDDDSGDDDDDLFAPGPEPTTAIVPVAGEVTIIQVDLAPSRLGEAAVVVGPDGSIALIDVGGSTHDDAIRDLLVELNTVHLVPARGFPLRSRLQVEWVVLTHFHGDHVGGFENLALEGDAITVTDGIVHRGFTDLGAAINENDVQALCEAVRGDLSSLDRPLCEAASPAPCRVQDRTGAYPSTSCAGLWRGDLLTAQGGSASTIDLAGATIQFVAANGNVSDGFGAAWTGGVPIGIEETGHENARSVVGLLTFGDFRYHFGGDLTGEGSADEPDVESVLADVAGEAFYGPRGVDVAHAHHHSRDSSSNPALVDLLAPDDGRSRNVVTGVNSLYVGSPHADVVEAWVSGGRLGTGRFWTTQKAFGGADSGDFEQVVVADGPVIVQTIQGGRGYRVQAGGDDVESAAWESVR